MKNCIIASTSTLSDQGYLSYLIDEIKTLFSSSTEIVFIPYARPGGITHDEYTFKVGETFKAIDKTVVGIHQFSNPAKAIKEANALFTGGGNTFLLVKALHDLNLMSALREAIYNGTPYLGTSAGSNICGVNMQTTNDMPIVYPTSFKTLGVLPFNINPHYLDPDPTSKHMGETRETRINEFHTQQNVPVVGLREGSWIRVANEKYILKGAHSARIFEKDKLPREAVSGSEINYF